MNTFLGMSDIALWGAVETGLIYALVAMGVYLSFRVLDFPNLTDDGSFPLGAAVCATMIVSGWDPWISTLGGLLAGALAGFVTAFIVALVAIKTFLQLIKRISFIPFAIYRFVVAAAVYVVFF